MQMHDVVVIMIVSCIVNDQDVEAANLSPLNSYLGIVPQTSFLGSKASDPLAAAALNLRGC